METELVDLQYMKAALAEAEAGMRKGEIPVGAVVVCQGRIIARAHNLSERLNDPTAHAEMQAITAATNYLGGKYLDSCTIYVTLEPCVMCAGALAWSQVARVVYGARDEKRGFLNLNQAILHPKTELTGGVLSEECGKLLIEFFKSRR